MSILDLILDKIVVLLLYVLLGYIGGKKLRLDQATIANLLFYFITPAVFFFSIATTTISLSIIALLIVILGLSCFLSLGCYFFTRNILKDSSRNILSYSAGTGNSGYFALPIVMSLMDHKVIGIFVICMIGLSIYENSLGYFLASLGRYNVKNSIKKILSLPAIYAFLAACLFSYYHIPIPANLLPMQSTMSAVFTVFGMMMIGLGCASITSLKLDLKFVSIALICKFIIWPLSVLLLIYLDHHFLHFYNREIYQVLLILSVVPMAANTVILSSIFHISPGKSAYTVLISTVIAVFYIPSMVTYMDVILDIILT
jgi:predicted permease